MQPCCGGWGSLTRLPPRHCSWRPIRQPISPARPSACRAEWDWAGSMARSSENIAAVPLDLVIERIRRVYRGWGRGTPVAQMRVDWDTAFECCTVPVLCERVSAAGVDGEWIAGGNAHY